MRLRLPNWLHPISRRLPILMVGLLSAVVAIVIWLAHARVERAVVDAATSRLHSSSLRVAEALQPSVRRMLTDAGRVTALPAVARLATRPFGAEDLRLASLALAEDRKRLPQTLAVAIWQGDSLLLVEGSRDMARQSAPVRITSSDGPPLARVGPLHITKDTIVFGTTADIRASGAVSTLAVVITRRIGNGSENVMARLIDESARLLLGNETGDLWTDLVSATNGPTPAAGDHSFEYRDDRNISRIAAMLPVAGTPWLIAVDMPRASATVVARRFLVDMLLIGAIVIILGGLGAWYTARGISRPLAEVTLAAEDLAAGDYDRRVDIVAIGEVERLSAAFNVMGEKVAASTRELARRAETLEATNRDLHESEVRYRNLIEHSPDGIVVHRDLSIVFANTAASRMLGLGVGESIVGRSVTDFVGDESRELVRERMRLVQDHGETAAPVALHLVRTDGSGLEVEGTAIPYAIDGSPAVQSILRDVTERKELEEQVRQSQKMEAIGRLAGGIAHDFNNLLTVIRSYSEFALEGYEADDPRRSDIEEVRRAAEAAAQLTRQLLTFSRKQIVAPQYVDLNAAIADTVGMLERLIGKRTELVTDLGPSIPGIWTDPGQLQQVVLNLAVNARDAMPDGGVLRLATSVVAVSTAGLQASGSFVPAGEYVSLEVGDTGIGMSSDVVTKMFEPFFTTKQTGRGTGLGLATAYGIIRQSAGHVRVTSELGRGTRFEILFPVHALPKVRLALPPIVEHKEPAAVARVLLVDDDTAVRRALSRALAGSHVTVIEAGDATTALALLDADPEPIDIVVTDMVMPGKSGLDLVREIRARHFNIPAIIMSGYSDQATGEGWLLPDNAAFMEKPIAPRDLVREVQQMLSQPIG